MLLPVSRRLQGRQRASPTLANTEPAAWCRPRGALGGGSRGWRGCKTSTGTHRRLGMRWGWPFLLDSAIQGASRTGFLFVVLFDGVPVEPSRGPRGTQWPPIPQCGEGRARLTFPRPVNHRESAFLAPGRHDRSTIRLEVYFFLATRATRIAGGRWATNDRLKGLPPGLIRL